MRIFTKQTTFVLCSESNMTKPEDIWLTLLSFTKSIKYTGFDFKMNFKKTSTIPVDSR